ncbi:MAG: DUF4118 domain-containing protein [Candidatus Levybacteria bacterium]|nr:DUF4118 domain-containing protein [Candidatus Levybacteria bacterium]
MKSILPFGKIGIKNKKTFYRFLLDHILAVVLPLAGLVLAMQIGPPFTTSASYLFFAPLVALSAWNGGVSAGTLSTIIGAAAMYYFFLSPEKSPLVFDLYDVIQIILVIIEGTFISFLIDIGKRKDKTLEYKKLIRELRMEVVNLEEESKKRLNELRSRDEFISIASHELKTPLTSMLLQTQTALHNIRNVSLAHFSIESLLKMLESVEDQTKRLSKMINDLLSVSVVATRKINLEYEKIDFNKLVENVLNDFSERIRRENYVVIYDAKEKITGNWDKIRIAQAISNLISNAIKYGDHKPIQIKLRKNRSFAEFIIKDEGIGISKQNQKYIFDLFRRGISNNQYKGLGVGLYISKEIIKAHGGKIEVTSKLAKGTKFTIKLPLGKLQQSPENN